MKLGVFTVCLYHMPFEQAAAYLHGQGVQCVEIGAGGYPNDDHLQTEKFLSDANYRQQFRDILARNELEVSAISCHGNPVHPVKEQAEHYHNQFEKAVLAAEMLGVDTVIGFSGIPGGAPGDTTPNWPVVSWPGEYMEALNYQWEILVPYWQKMAKFCADHGVTKIALEPHGGFCVYSPATLLRLREAVGGTAIGANFDPSHMIWQGMDPSACARALEGAIYHFHAKDTKITHNAAVNGVLDIRHYGDEANRSWLFRTVGYGQSTEMWKDLFSTLRLCGYDGAISIEHEDSLMSPREGLEKAIAFLKETIMFEDKGSVTWA
ncbi:MAG: sugar phosphate isomerase/epimerase [Oscillospiraceae bacterium]|nr:sugar phosphate isomerase/epimerase [Oscillospiraceae bacterium]